MILKVICLGVCGVIISLILKQIKPEFCLLFNLCLGLIMSSMMIDHVKEIIENLFYLNDLTGLKLDIVTPILKVIGIGYITEFTADLAEESGNKSIADKIIFGGKIAVCVLAIPIIKKLINAILSFV